MSERAGQFETEQAQRVLRGEAPPPAVEIEHRLGVPLDLVSGRLVCGKCGGEDMALRYIAGWPSPLSPELAAIFMACRSCSSEQALSVSDDGTGATLSTALTR